MARRSNKENLFKAWDQAFREGDAGGSKKGIQAKLRQVHKNNPVFHEFLKSRGLDVVVTRDKTAKAKAKAAERKSAGLKAYGATKGTKIGGEYGAGQEFADTTVPLSPEQHAKVKAAEKVAKPAKPEKKARKVAKKAPPAAPKPVDRLALLKQIASKKKMNIAPVSAKQLRTIAAVGGQEHDHSGWDDLSGTDYEYVGRGGKMSEEVKKRQVEPPPSAMPSDTRIKPLPKAKKGVRLGSFNKFGNYTPGMKEEAMQVDEMIPYALSAANYQAELRRQEKAKIEHEKNVKRKAKEQLDKDSEDTGNPFVNWKKMNKEEVEQIDEANYIATADSNPDMLASSRYGTTTTKAPKGTEKAYQKLLKRQIKNRIGLHRKPNLPEEVEQIDEIKTSTKLAVAGKRLAKGAAAAALHVASTPLVPLSGVPGKNTVRKVGNAAKNLHYRAYDAAKKNLGKGAKTIARAIPEEVEQVDEGDVIDFKNAKQKIADKRRAAAEPSHDSDEYYKMRQATDKEFNIASSYIKRTHGEHRYLHGIGVSEKEGVIHYEHGNRDGSDIRKGSMLLPRKPSVVKEEVEQIDERRWNFAQRIKRRLLPGVGKRQALRRVPDLVDQAKTHAVLGRGVGSTRSEKDLRLSRIKAKAAGKYSKIAMPRPAAVDEAVKKPVKRMGSVARYSSADKKWQFVRDPMVKTITGVSEGLLSKLFGTKKPVVKKPPVKTYKGLPDEMTRQPSHTRSEYDANKALGAKK